MPETRRAIALGFFDGIHIGHAAILNRVAQRAKELNCAPTVITFDEHPKVLMGHKNISLIVSQRDRAGLIRRGFGIEDIVSLDFDDTLRHMSWNDFLGLLVNKYGAAHLVAGYDYRFGYKGAGDAEKLKSFCGENGLSFDIIPPITLYDRVSSSTLIRELLLKGDIALANEYLGHPHVLTDIVRSGNYIGHSIGVPTINTHFEPEVLIPAHGVYASKVYLENGETYFGVSNIGTKPTVSKAQERAICETHIFNFGKEIYGQSVRIEFYKLLRPETRFNNIDELKNQIEKDIISAKRHFQII